jgi:hypothetical protein
VDTERTGTTKESGAIRGRQRGEVPLFGGVREGRVPVEVVGEFVVEDSGADLEQEVGTARGPTHLLLVDHAFADHLVDGRLDERGGDGLAGPMTLAVVGPVLLNVSPGAK